jgi:hypothetical protein
MNVGPFHTCMCHLSSQCVKKPSGTATVKRGPGGLILAGLNVGSHGAGQL